LAADHKDLHVRKLAKDADESAAVDAVLALQIAGLAA
jgi:hypothetical protein